MSSPQNSTTVLQAHGKLVVLLVHNEPSWFTSINQTCCFVGAQRTKLICKYQPNLLFCWLTTNQVDLQVSTKLVVLLANNEPIQIQEFDNKKALKWPDLNKLCTAENKDR